MADETRRIGCGCLPLLAIFFAASLLFAALEDVAGQSLPSGLLAGGLAVFLLLALFGAAMRRRQRAEADDDAADGGPVPTTHPRPVSPPRPVSYTPAPPPPERTSREVRSGARDLSTEPEDPDSKAFKKKLADAVADLADNVEDMPGPGEPGRMLSSEEMIARAKKRISDFRDPD